MKTDKNNGITKGDIDAIIKSVVAGQNPSVIHAYRTDAEFLERSGLSKLFSKKLASIDVPQGGLVSGPSEIIGEHGPEAIIPLERIKELIALSDGNKISGEELKTILFEEE